MAPTEAARVGRLGLALAWLVLGAAGMLWAVPDLPSRAQGWLTGEVVAGCDPALPGCSAPAPGGGRVGLRVSPEQAPPETPVRLDFTVEPPAKVVGLRLTGVDMPMGIQHPNFVATDRGVQADLQLAACTMAAMRWRVDASLEGGGQVSFVFTSHRDADAPAARVWDVIAAAEAPTWPAFTLQTTEGELRSDAFADDVVLVYFGYTACPDVCPTTLASLGAAARGLPEAEAARVHGLFVSLDPERDALERLDAYARHFHPNFRGGHVAELAAVSAAWGVGSRKVALDGSALGYAVDHGTSSYLRRPDGAIEVIPHGEAVEVTAGRLLAALRR